MPFQFFSLEDLILPFNAFIAILQSREMGLLQNKQFIEIFIVK